jgi:hypothetical protein
MTWLHHPRSAVESGESHPVMMVTDLREGLGPDLGQQMGQHPAREGESVVRTLI